MIGQTVSHYKILETLGSGGAGVVYKASDLKLDRLVALKFLPSYADLHKEELERFIREAKTASSFDHPNICTIYEIGETPPTPEAPDGRMFISMACYAGETLREKLSGGRLTVETALDYATQLAKGLGKAHDKGIVHRDVKPANIIITDEGVLKIVDFGLAKLASDAKLTRTGATLGTVAYMSPEQAHGETVDHRTDIWSFGVVLYEMLTGELPFKGEFEQAVIYSILNAAPKPIEESRPETPPELTSIVEKTLQKDADSRYQNVGGLLADLDAYRNGGEATLSEKRSSDSPAGKKRKPRLAFVGALVSLLLITLLFWDKLDLQPDQNIGQPRISALPFSFENGNPHDETLSKGLLYVIANILTRAVFFQDSIKIVSPDKAFEERLDADLKPNQFLTGRVSRKNQKLDLVLIKVDAISRAPRDSITLNIDPENYLTFQNEIARRITDFLEMKLPEKRLRLLQAGGTNARDAYAYYLSALGRFDQFSDEEKIDSAILMLEQAVSKDASFAAARLALAEANFQKFEINQQKTYLEQAIDHAEQAIQADSLYALAGIALGKYLNKSGRYPEAETALTSAIKIDGSDANAYRELAIVQDRQNKLAEAETNYKKAIQRDPENGRSYNNLGIFYHQQARHREAAVQFRQVTKYDPGNFWGYNNLAVQYDRLDSLDLTISWYERATQIDPAQAAPTATAFFNLGKIYYRLDKLLEATDRFSKALALRESYFEVWHYLGNAYHYSGKPDSAQAAWGRAIEFAEINIEINPKDAAALKVLAGAYAMRQDRASALEMIQKLLNLERKDAPLFEMVGMTYEVLGERELALQYIEIALKNGVQIMSLETSKWLKDLRTDPRYKTLITKYTNNQTEN